MAKKNVSYGNKSERVVQFARKQGLNLDLEALEPMIARPLTHRALQDVYPITDVQKEVFEAWGAGLDLNIMGSAGTGKTYLAMYLALREVMNPDIEEFTKVIIVRSIVPVRDVGFLPGELDEKIAPYEAPYTINCEKLLGRATAYKHLKQLKQVEFVPTSFVQGTTLDNAIIIVDESENLNLHELDAIYTRMGKHTRIIFAGDTVQNCLRKEASGLEEFSSILEGLDSMATITMTAKDIVRNKKVRDYIIRRDSKRAE